jgi:hypothetical protein
LDPLRVKSVEHFGEARLISIARGGCAIWLNPFGMLDPQVVVNLLLELGIGVDFVIHGYWPGERFKCAGGQFPKGVRRNGGRTWAP